MDRTRGRKRKNAEEEEESETGFKRTLTSPDEYSGAEGERTEHHSNAMDDVQTHASQAEESAADSAIHASNSETAAALTTMADLLASAAPSQDAHISDHHHQQQQQQHHDHNDGSNGRGGVSADVLRMQQQLQQQIEPEASNRLTREQIMESMTGIPSMRQIIEGDFQGREHTGSADDRAHMRQMDAHAAATAEATSVLMNLGDASAILASLKPSLHLPEAEQSSDRHEVHHGSRHDTPEEFNGQDVGHDQVQAQGEEEALPPIISNRKSSGPGIRRRFESPELPTTDPEALARTLEQQLEIDLAVRTSTNPLHTKWLMATALKDKGIAYKTGTFSTNEDDIIRRTIKEYVLRNKMPEDAIQRWFNNGSSGRGRLEKNDLKALWVEIAVRLQTRPLLNIYLHVRRMFHPQNNVGAWSKEDDDKLVELHAKHKGQWTTIGQELGRMADSCRDRYRNHLKDLSTMVTGPWQPQEDEQLLRIMQELALKQGKASILDSNPMWTQISERMGGTRTRHQCRHRFSQTLQPRLERGEWTGPSSAAAAAAAAVAANASSAAAAVKQQQQQLQHQQQQQQHHHQSGSNSPHRTDENKTASAQDVMLLAAALQGVLPETADSNNLWSQAMNRMGDTGGDHLHGGDMHPGPLSNNDPFTAAALAAAASLPLPSFVPKAPKGPIRRRGGLQQQLDVLRLIQEYGYTDHVDINWSDIAQRLRDDVQESNAIQLAKIIQTHDQLDSKKQQQIQDGDTNAAAAAAATAAMAAAVSAAQSEAVASLQRIPAANQIARTFMSSRCKTEGYRSMTLKQVVKIMMEDVERRIQQRRRGSSGSQLNTSQLAESDEGTGASSSSMSAYPHSSTTGAMLQQQEINDAAQQAAIEALTAQYSFLQQQYHDEFHNRHNGRGPHDHGVHLSVDEDGTETLVYPSHSSSTSSIPKLSPAEFELQSQNRALAERMLNVAFTNSDMNNTSAAAAAAAAASNSAHQKKQQAQATRQLLSALKSDDFPTGESSDVHGGGSGADHAEEQQS